MQPTPALPTIVRSQYFRPLQRINTNSTNSSNNTNISIRTNGSKQPATHSNESSGKQPLHIPLQSTAPDNDDDDNTTLQASAHAEVAGEEDEDAHVPKRSKSSSVDVYIEPNAAVGTTWVPKKKTVITQFVIVICCWCGGDGGGGGGGGGVVVIFCWRSCYCGVGGVVGW
jgi:hypothetical protein